MCVRERVGVWEKEMEYRHAKSESVTERMCMRERHTKHSKSDRASGRWGESKGKRKKRSQI